MRVGQGFDVHQLVEGRKLIIGGTEIPYERGLLGHSDADVLLHAICDALLGAANGRDLLRIWTVKEALFKADLGGQQRWVTAYELDYPNRRSGTARVRAGGRVQHFRYISIEVPGGMLSAAFALHNG